MKEEERDELLKLSFWLDRHRNAITREIKRLELAIAALSEK